MVRDRSIISIETVYMRQYTHMIQTEDEHTPSLTGSPCAVNEQCTHICLHCSDVIYASMCVLTQKGNYI